tara:strand:- start:57 stop:422 length:366 start_codon:yes stop_codon:yes gene_type:complete
MLSPREMRVYYECIKEDYGIDLTWSEKVALSHYVSSYQSQWRNEVDELGEATFIPYVEGIHRFMKDYFDLEAYELGKTPIRSLTNGKVRFVDHGLEVLGTELFKELCRKRVDFWRDQRTFP